VDNVQLMREVHEPYERGEGDPDFQSIWDHVDDDVVYESPVGRLRGKQTVIDYFSRVSELAEFWPFERPIDYFSDGDRVVMMCEESVKVRQTGASTRGEWIWVLELRDGLITSIVHFLHFEDLSILVDQLKAAYDETTAAAA
jgi:uncharacterized protein